MSEKHAKPPPTGLPIIHERAAGIDRGSRVHVAAVSPELSDEPVRTFHAFTSDVHRMADWRIDTGITTVAMESTGVYGVAAYEVRESRGLEVMLANARARTRSPAEKATSMMPNGCNGSTHAGCCGQASAPDVTSRRYACIGAHVSARWTMLRHLSSTGTRP